MMTRYFVVVPRDSGTASFEVDTYEKAIAAVADAFGKGDKAYVFSGPDMETVLAAYPGMVKKDS